MKPEELSHQYDPLADTFESVLEVGNRVSKGALREMLPPIEGKSVLDIGCGEGSDCSFYLKN
jgi:ubiquinone/menaquinone biosynthesis C-methylase UbiE